MCERKRQIDDKFLSMKGKKHFAEEQRRNEKKIKLPSLRFFREKERERESDRKKRYFVLNVSGFYFSPAGF